MTCSWCDKKIPIFRSLSGSRYCCAEHEKEEAAALRRVAIQRLRNTPAFQQLEQTQSSIRDLTGADCDSADSRRGAAVRQFEPARA